MKLPYDPYTPTWYQVEDSNTMLATEDAYLWADAGTGKTVTALEAFRKGKYDRGVVICPKIAITMWKEEIEKHLGMRAYPLIRGIPPKKAVGIILHADTSFIITTFDLAKKHDTLIKAFVKGLPTTMYKSWKPELVKDLRTALILDEAHYLKSRDAKRTIAIFGPQANQMGIGKRFTDVWQLTGTPVMRHVDDLWTQLKTYRYHILKHYGVHEYDKFVEKFCTTKFVQYTPRSPRRKVVNGSTNLKLLKTMTDQCGVIRRKLKDVVHDLPPITHRQISTSYTGVPDIDIDLPTLIRELADKDGVMAKVRVSLGKAKAADVVKYAMEFGKSPLLIGFWHRDVCAVIAEQLYAAQPSLIINIVNGDTSSQARDYIQTEFNAGRVDILLGQMQAMGTSWNLQNSCSHVLIAEELPGPGMLHQFYSRVYRKGQERHVHVDHMTSEHRLDTLIKELRLSKAAANEAIEV